MEEAMGQVSNTPLEEDGEPGHGWRQERRRVALRAHLFRPGGLQLHVNLVDLSFDGCQIEVPRFIAEDEEVRLSVDGHEPIAATVRWCREGRAGLKFDDIPEGREPVERSSQRTAATIEAQVRRAGHLSYVVDVRDISPEGCRIDLVERPAVGDVMQVKISGLETLDAEVRWIDGYVAGLLFRHAIHPAVFDLLLSRVRV